jgi:hypothetical protein
MRFHWSAFLLSLGALFTANASDSQRQYDTQAAPAFLFDRSPIRPRYADRTPGQRMEPGARVVMFSQAPYLRTRPETLTLSRAEVPALTITADPSNFVEVTGAKRDDWSLRFCAQGEGDSEGEAREHLQSISMSRLGSAVSLNSSGLGHTVGARGNLLIEAPVDAPLVIHASFAAVEVRDMAGPVRVTATHARAKILDTTGKVDATGSVVDFAGSGGTVNLSAEAEVNLKLNTVRFDGSLAAWAQRSVRVLVPPASQTPFQAFVNRPKDFVCRTDFCPKVKREVRGGVYVFTYAGDGSTPPEQVHLRSEHAAVVIDIEGTSSSAVR